MWTPRKKAIWKKYAFTKNRCCDLSRFHVWPQSAARIVHKQYFSYHNHVFVFIESSWEKAANRRQHKRSAAFEECRTTPRQGCHRLLCAVTDMFPKHCDYLSQLSVLQSRTFNFLSTCFPMPEGIRATKGAKHGFVAYEIIFTIIISTRKEKRTTTWKWPHSTKAFASSIDL